MSRESTTRMSRIWTSMAVGLATSMLVFFTACKPGIPNHPSSTGLPNAPPAGADLAISRQTIETQIESFCGACHLTPRPEHFPRREWRREVEQGYHLYFQSDRTNLAVPVMSEVIAFYEQHAPGELSLPPARTTIDPGGLTFRQSLGPESPQLPAVAHLSWISFSADNKSVVVRSTSRLLWDS